LHSGEREGYDSGYAKNYVVCNDYVGRIGCGYPHQCSLTSSTIHHNVGSVSDYGALIYMDGTDAGGNGTLTGNNIHDNSITGVTQSSITLNVQNFATVSGNQLGNNDFNSTYGTIRMAGTSTDNGGNLCKSGGSIATGITCH